MANKITGANSRPASQIESRGLRRRSLVVESHGGCHSRAAVAQFTSEIIRQAIFQFLFTGFLNGLLPNSTLSKRAMSGLLALRNAAS